MLHNVLELKKHFEVTITISYNITHKSFINFILAEKAKPLIFSK